MLLENMLEGFCGSGYSHLPRRQTPNLREASKREAKRGTST
jgi:hypothetical protein